MTAWLLTWLWQGVALAVSLSIALHLLPRLNAATRHLVWWGAFAALILLGWQSLPGGMMAADLPAAANAAASGAAGRAMPVIDLQPLPAWALWFISLLWASVALFRLLRIFPGLNALHRLKHECRPFPRGVEAQLPLWREARGRRARLMLCDRLAGAAVLGLRDPCIAIPSSLVTELSAGDLDQIILHEYGHVQRRDDWMRLLQTLLESALWMHPAAFLIGRELNLEREVACDDWVVARTGSPKNYAACLSRAAEQGRFRIAPAFAQSLFGGNRDLFRRVDRLLNARRNSSRSPSFLAAAACVAVVAACAVQLRAFPLVSDAAVTPVLAGSPGPREAAGSRTDTPVAAGFPGPREVAGSRTDDDVSVTDAPTASGLSRIEANQKSIVRLKPDTTDTPVQPKPDTTETRTPMLSGVRSFEGVYRTAGAAIPSTAAVTPWQRAADAGVGIGTATRKAGVDLANSFTRAGTAIARRF